MKIHIMTLTKHKARQQKLRREAALIDELKTKYECQLCEHWEQRVVFKYYKY